MTKRRTEIESVLRKIAQRELALSEDEVDGKIARLDSLERMQLAMAVEDSFHILLEARDEAELGSLEDLAALVARKLDRG